MMIDVIPLNGETWVICGGRNFDDQQMFDSAMGDLVRLFGMPDRVVHGDCRTGADKMADAWATKHGLHVIRVPAEWDKYDRAAGPIRNQAILDRYPNCRLVSFPGGRGTADMVRRARSKPTVEVIEIQQKVPA